MKILNQMLEQFRLRHRRNPDQIVVSPQAAVVIAARRSLAPIWNGVPVACQNVSNLKPVPGKTRLLVDVERSGSSVALRSADG